MEKRIHKKVDRNRAKVIVALWFVLLMTLALPAWAEDPDYGNDPNSAEPIDPNGTIVEGVLSPADEDEDWFSFSAIAEGLYRISFWSQSGQKGLYVYGLDEFDQLTEITNLWASSGTTTNDIFIEQRFAGTCYLKVYPSGSGLYRVSVNLLSEHPTDTYADTCVNADELIVDGDPVYDGITEHGTDEDWFTFATGVLHKYQVSSDRAYNSDVVFDLYADDCVTSLANDRTSITFVSWYGGDRNLRVRSSSFNKEGYYGIWVDDLGEQPDDHGNTYDVATPINTIGDPCEGILQYTADLGSDEDWFSFTAVAEGLYRISLWSQSGQKGLYVYGLDEFDQLTEITNLWASSGTTTNDIFIEQRFAGTCYLKVYPSGSGLYRVSVLSPAPQCGDLNHPYPGGDANHDCVVDFVDFAILANNWLADNRP